MHARQITDDLLFLLRVELLELLVSVLEVFAADTQAQANWQMIRIQALSGNHCPTSSVAVHEQDPRVVK